MIGIRNKIVKHAVEESEGVERNAASLAEKEYREALGRELSTGEVWGIQKEVEKQIAKYEQLKRAKILASAEAYRRTKG